MMTADDDPIASLFREHASRRIAAGEDPGAVVEEMRREGPAALLEAIQPALLALLAAAVDKAARDLPDEPGPALRVVGGVDATRRRGRPAR